MAVYVSEDLPLLTRRPRLSKYIGRSPATATSSKRNTQYGDGLDKPVWKWSNQIRRQLVTVERSHSLVRMAEIDPFQVNIVQ